MSEVNALDRHIFHIIVLYMFFSSVYNSILYCSTPGTTFDNTFLDILHLFSYCISHTIVHCLQIYTPYYTGTCLHSPFRLRIVLHYRLAAVVGYIRVDPTPEFTALLTFTCSFITRAFHPGVAYMPFPLPAVFVPGIVYTLFPLPAHSRPA